MLGFECSVSHTNTTLKTTYANAASAHRGAGVLAASQATSILEETIEPVQVVFHMLIEKQAATLRHLHDTCVLKRRV